MSRPSTCGSCRHWQRLSEVAVVGRCTEKLADADYTNRRHHCPRHRLVSCTTARGRELISELAARQAQLSRTLRRLTARTATNAEITRQLAAEMNATLKAARGARKRA